MSGRRLRKGLAGNSKSERSDDGGGEDDCGRLMGEGRTDRSVCFTLGHERVISSR
jgi:hypothetical protein